MTTRAGAAAHSHQVQQRLVRLLYDHEYVRKGRDQHRKLDFAAYTYSDLKKAYLKRIQTIHPDKFFYSSQDTEENRIKRAVLSKQEDESVMRREKLSDKHMTTYFIELQEAWKGYEKFYKHMKQVSKDKDEGNFTMFGVGCSFSDNPAERERRNEIMDQACKGWFSSGYLNEKEDTCVDTNASQSSALLSDEDLFVCVKNLQTAHVDSTPLGVTPKRSLVDHLRNSKKVI